MKNNILSMVLAGAVAFGAVNANAALANADKPVSKISDVQNMADDTIVYIQGYLINALGDEKYTFKDDSGTMMIEIDDDLMRNNNYTAETLVWIAAEVDKDGNVVSLDADEIQFTPVQGENAPVINNSDKPISKISDVQNMADDTIVYIHGYLINALGDEKYTFKDDSGTMMIEIDDDLMRNNNYTAETLVWIAAEVDKDGDVVSLDADEIQFTPAQN